MSDPGRLDFYSSVGGAGFLTRMLAALGMLGWSVEGVHALTEEDYRSGGQKLWHKAVRRWRMYVGYAATCWARSGQGAPAARTRIVTTNPFFAPWLVSFAAGGRGITVNLVYDLFPDALIQAGMIDGNSHLCELLAEPTRRALRECTATVFLGERLQQYAESKYGRARRSFVMPVGADGAPFCDSPPAMLSDGETIRILYAGNLGRMHDSRTVIDALRQGLPDGVEMAFHVSGSGVAELRVISSLTARCRMGAPLHDLAWVETMKRSQVALVTIAAGAEKVVMPSKTYSALVAGQAILAVCRGDSDLAELVRTHDCGWICEPGDTAGLRRILQEMAFDPHGLHRLRCNAFKAGHGKYDTGLLAAEWDSLLRDLLLGADQLQRPTI